jgi:RNA polymerase sigma-70 factor, ECF subfamily
MSIDAIFDQLITEHWPYLRNRAIRLCQGNHDDAEDLLSETMIDAYRAFHNYYGTGFDRWFFHIMEKNRIDMSRRARARRADITESLAQVSSREDDLFVERDIIDSHYEPERVLFQKVYSEPLANALAKLNDVFKVPLLLYDVDELEYAEIATMLSIPLGTVRSRIHRARNHMRKMMTPCIL